MLPLWIRHTSAVLFLLLIAGNQLRKRLAKVS
jgi:hypothetical protein